ncbi:MAG: hypothetical protein ACHQIM_20175 [Sphingobacteriales bacterium]
MAAKEKKMLMVAGNCITLTLSIYYDYYCANSQSLNTLNYSLMSLKCSLLILMTLVAIKTKAQILINADANQIKKEIMLRGGTLKRSFVEKDIEMHGYYHKMIFQFGSPPEGNSGIINMTFCLTLKNKCFKYYQSNWGRDLVDETIEKFNKSSYGLNRIKSSLKWVNLDRNFEASIDSQRVGKNKIFSVYILEIKKSDYKIRSSTIN